MTVNELLVLQKEVRSRVNDLKHLRSQVSTTDRTYFGDTQRKEIEPQYDVKLVDKKITELETWLFKADSAVKQSNAMTQVKVEADVDKLLAHLE